MNLLYFRVISLFTVLSLYSSAEQAGLKFREPLECWVTGVHPFKVLLLDTDISKPEEKSNPLERTSKWLEEPAQRSKHLLLLQRAGAQPFSDVCMHQLHVHDLPVPLPYTQTEITVKIIGIIIAVIS